MQKGSWALKKSTSVEALLKHTLVYSVLVSVGVGILMYYNIDCKQCLPCYILIFLYITFITHTITDFFTSKKTSREYKRNNFGTSIPRGFDFYVTLGFDQLLHTIQLYVTYVILIK